MVIKKYFIEKVYFKFWKIFCFDSYIDPMFTIFYIGSIYGGNKLPVKDTSLYQCTTEYPYCPFEVNLNPRPIWDRIFVSLKAFAHLGCFAMILHQVNRMARLQHQISITS
jgi:hypothetical protein